MPVGTVSNLPAAGIRLGRERPYHSSAGVSSVRKDGDFWCFPILPSPIALQLWESGQGPLFTAKQEHWSVLSQAPFLTVSSGLKWAWPYPSQIPNLYILWIQ